MLPYNCVSRLFRPRLSKLMIISVSAKSNSILELLSVKYNSKNIFHTLKPPKDIQKLTKQASRGLIPFLYFRKNSYSMFNPLLFL